MTSTDRLLALDSASQDLLFRRAHTVNAFGDGPVSDETVREIHDLVRSLPTASGGQPLRVVLVRSAAGRERQLRHMSRGNREKTALAPLVAVLAAGPMSGFDAQGVAEQAPPDGVAFASGGHRAPRVRILDQVGERVLEDTARPDHAMGVLCPDPVDLLDGPGHPTAARVETVGLAVRAHMHHPVRQMSPDPRRPRGGQRTESAARRSVTAWPGGRWAAAGSAALNGRHADAFVVGDPNTAVAQPAEGGRVRRCPFARRAGRIPSARPPPHPHR